MTDTPPSLTTELSPKDAKSGNASMIVHTENVHNIETQIEAINKKTGVLETQVNEIAGQVNTAANALLQVTQAVNDANTSIANQLRTVNAGMVAVKKVLTERVAALEDKVRGNTTNMDNKYGNKDAKDDTVEKLAEIEATYGKLTATVTKCINEVDAKIADSEQRLATEHNKLVEKQNGTVSTSACHNSVLYEHRFRLDALERNTIILGVSVIILGMTSIFRMLTK